MLDLQRVAELVKMNVPEESMRPIVEDIVLKILEENYINPQIPTLATWYHKQNIKESTRYR